ncbi:amidase [Sphingorhabdus arenilitoris]|uniref:Amidase n=1 Tax=Sphingorhabdus arenilitoris TaxID=1490041 RepID=A0ABV8RG48_9SPHN
MTFRTFAFAALLITASPAAASVAPPPSTQDASAAIEKYGPIENLSLFELADGIDDGLLNSEAIVAAYLKRIAEIDDAGPTLNAVIATFPDALDQARAMDAEIKAGKYRGPLHGLPILLKDNIEAKGDLPTTAGSLALKGNITQRDAPMVARLREAGAVILGKTNLSEWANIRSDDSTSGWSAIGGLTKNPHALDRNTCGSSAGSGAAMAAGLAAATIGTETNGSIVCPSSVNGIVGFKPTVGLVSRTHIVPISHTQDTAGPMTKTVLDAAILLTAMAGTDPADSATKDADTWRGDYANGLRGGDLKNARIGILRDEVGDNAGVAELFDQAVAQMKAAGAVIVEIADSGIGLDSNVGRDEGILLFGELKYDMAAYLQSLPAGLVPHKNLADLIAFNAANPDTELQYFDQSGFERGEATTLSKEELQQLADSLTQRVNDHINRLLVTHKVDFLVQPTNGPAWLSALGKGDDFTGPSASSLAAIAGAPHLTVPMGAVGGLPVGISFTGARWHDHAVLKVGYAYEQISNARVTPTYAASIEPPKPVE